MKEPKREYPTLIARIFLYTLAFLGGLGFVGVGIGFWTYHKDRERIDQMSEARTVSETPSTQAD